MHYGTVCRRLHLAEPVDGAQVQLRVLSGAWCHGVIDKARTTVTVMEDNHCKRLRNVIRISHAGHALTDRQLKLILCISWYFWPTVLSVVPLAQYVVCRLSSVTFCIVAKRYVLANKKA